ncbi:MAG: acylneuraminate cytidylyltransferase family protein [Legionellaceae bacterium]|nr:acylneuraminate cytidylyltransferase family protein [Legionellaceae bacterium]
MFALLPMKENSERVPEKNFKHLNGKPLFFYIADTLRATGLFERLVINTDSKLIEDLAHDQYGEWVTVIMRPKALQGDHVSMNSVLAHDIEVLGSDNDFMQVHSTSPLLKLETIIEAHRIYYEGKSLGDYDSLFSVNTIKTRLYDKNLKPINHVPSLLGRTQDLDMIYEENSNFYFFSGSSFKNNNHRIGLKAQIFGMSRNSIESLDIDDLADWEFAEIILKAGLV